MESTVTPDVTLEDLLWEEDSADDQEDEIGDDGDKETMAMRSVLG